MTRGVFVTLEGGEGVGKSTQAARIAEVLRGQGKTVVVTREPGGTPGAEAIRTLLMTGAADRWSARAEALLFAAARTDHVERVVEPALARGDWVVCDRYLDSTRAYQGGAGGVSDDDVMALHRIGAGLLPTRTLLFTLPVPVATARASVRDGGHDDRFGRRDGAWHAELAERFAALAQGEPERFRLIDADGAPEVVTVRALAALEDLA